MEDNYFPKRNKYKVLFFILLAVIIIETGWIYLQNKLNNSLLLPNYQYIEAADNLISAEGSWISTTELAGTQTIKFTCWKRFGHCWVMDATLYDDYLSVDYDIAQIARWDDDVIETIPEETALGCVEYTYKIDRKSETVTSIRNTVDNTSDICSGIQDEPIIMHLGDGLERLSK